MSTKFHRLLTRHKLGKHREFLESVARPSIEIIPTKTFVTVGCSKWGGAPDLPVGFAWPQWSGGPHRFLGQFNLADIPEGHGLPASGLLSFFVADDPNGEKFWQDADYLHVVHFPNVSEVRPRARPESVRRGTFTAIQFIAEVDVPGQEWFRTNGVAWPFDDDEADAYLDLRLALHPSGQYLLGYPLNSTLGYDPTPGPEWRSLLTLNSDDALDWCWHDGDWLVAFIRDQQLRVGDFSEIKADAG